MLRHLLLISASLATLLAGARRAAAQSGASGGISLDSLLALAARSNPDLRLARLRLDSSRAELGIARSWSNPVLDIIPGSPYQYGLGVPLDIGPQRRYRARAASLATGAARWDVRDASRQLAFAARSGYYDALLADTLAALAAEGRDLVRQLLATDSVRFRAGDAPLRSITRTELALASAEAMLGKTRFSADSTRLQLGALVGLDRPDVGWRMTGSLAIRLDSARTLVRVVAAPARRSDVLAARERVAQSEALISYAWSALVPVPMVNFVWQPQPYDNTAPSPLLLGGSRQVAVGIGFELPLWRWYGPERDRARSGLASAQVAAERVERLARIDVTTARLALDLSTTRVARFDGGLLGRADEALAQARFAYVRGAASLLEVLDALRAWLDARSDYLIATHDALTAHAALEAALAQEEH